MTPRMHHQKWKEDPIDILYNKPAVNHIFLAFAIQYKASMLLSFFKTFSAGENKAIVFTAL